FWFMNKAPITSRHGVTLVEVLVAIFVTSVGLLALLALFPIGALNMYQAIKDSRCAQAAINANAVLNAMQLRTDAAITPGRYQGDPLNPPMLPLLTNPSGPGYPIYIDPLGNIAAGSTVVGDGLTSDKGIPRVSPQGPLLTIATIPQSYRWFAIG